MLKKQNLCKERSHEEIRICLVLQGPTEADLQEMGIIMNCVTYRKPQRPAGSQELAYEASPCSRWWGPLRGRESMIRISQEDLLLG